MKIIIIKGKMNSGKTTTAGLVYSELLKIAEPKHTFKGKNVTTNSLQYNSAGNLKDFTAVLVIGNTTVGIISAGDIAKDLKVQIEIMISLNIDILICCTRSVNRSGSAYRMVMENYSKEHEIIKELSPQYIKDATQKYDVKKRMVGEIVNLVRNS